MKKSKFKESQILEALQEAESSVPVAEVCRKRHRRYHLLPVEAQVRWHEVPSELHNSRTWRSKNTQLKRMYAGLAHANTSCEKKGGAIEN